MQVLCNKFNWVGRSFFGALRQGLKQDGHNSLVKVLSKRQVLNGGILSRGSIGSCSSFRGAGSGLVYITEKSQSATFTKFLRVCI